MAELVGLQAQTPDLMQKLSQLLTIQGQRAQVQQEQQTARQRAALANYDWNKLVGEDGTIDLDRLADPELLHAAGDDYQKVVSNAISAREQQLQAKKSLLGLRDAQRASFGSMVGGLLTDADINEDSEKGRQKANQAMVQWAEMAGNEDAIPVLEAYGRPLQKVPQGRLRDYLKTIALQSQDVSQQIASQTPNLVNTGSQLEDISPVTSPTSSPKRLSIGPGNAILQDAAGAQYVWDQQTNKVTPVGSTKDAPARSEGTAPSGGPAPSAPPKSSFKQPTYIGQKEDIARNQEEVANLRAAADQAPSNRNIFQHILQLSNDTSTGPLVSYLQNTKIGGQVFGDNYQELSKYLEKNAIANMQAMGGPPSDARLSAAVAANGSTKFNPAALRAVTEFNYATNTGLEKYRQAMDAVIGTENPDYTKLPKFKSEWAKNFDIDVFRLENAYADGDKAAQKEILGGLSKEKAADLLRKMRNIDSLAETGKLPNE